MRTSVPAVVNLPGTTSAVEALATSIHAEVAALSYRGPESLQDATDIRQRAMALSEVMRRAGLDGTEALIGAREAERALGLMLAIGREAGDIANRGRDIGATNLSDLGIQTNLAADCATLARLTEEDWDVLVATARHSAGERVSRGARQMLAARESAERVQATAAEHAREVAEAARKAAERLSDLLTAPYTPLQPTLQPDELRMDFHGYPASAPRVTEATDNSIDAQRHRAAVKVMDDLTHMLERTPPVLTDDVWTAVNVLSARATVARLTDALAAWLRMLNRQWDEATGEDDA
jgi:hypothetical protein